MQPLSIRPANAQAQKDLESLDYFTRKWRLDSGFVRGIVIRFAKYELHERLEKKLFECLRLDLMVRKSLKEKHLIDALWPSPAPRSEPHELLAQGVQVRRWYGDMFAKYFTVLHSVDEFELRPEIDQRIKSSGTLMLVPFVDHLVIGGVEPITPIVARGAGYANNKALDSRGRSRSDAYGEPGRFEIRFDAPSQTDETYTKSVVRQCQCLKCGTKRDVQVVISVDPNPNGGAPSRQSITTNTAVQRRLKANERQELRHEEVAPPQPPRPQPQSQLDPAPRPSTPEQKKQCPRCTFLNHASLSECEMCSAPLPNTTVTKPPSPSIQRTEPRVSHSHSASLPPPTTAPDRLKAEERPGPPNRHSLSSTLFSIFPFSQQQQQEHHAKLPPTQQTDIEPAVATSQVEPSRPEPQRARKQKEKETSEAKRQRDAEPKYRGNPVSSSAAGSAAPAVEPPSTVTPPTRPDSPKTHQVPADEEAELSRPPEMAMMPLTPPPTTSQQRRQVPVGLPSHLMDDYVPPSPALPAEDEEDAGWSDLRRKESNVQKDESSDDEDDEGKLVDLDAVAREEMGVWGEREDE